MEVLLVPHSHDDYGWIATPEEYYVNSVREIYTNVLECLRDHPERRFIFVEVSFFSRWFQEITEDQRELFRNLLKSGQVEFVGGGWVMHDEACTTELGMMNNMMLGLIWLNNELGVVPQYGYQIDPFGHSAITPYLFSELRYKALVGNRIHHSTRHRLEDVGSMEFVWNQEGRSILTHLLDEHYSAPPDTDFEKDPPIRDEKRLIALCTNLVEQWKSRAKRYLPHGRFLQLIGDDFKYKNAQVQFENWDLIINYINTHSKEFDVKVRYATLDEYFEPLLNGGAKFPRIESSDFFPYADNEESYWTGYFTSKSALKKLSRYSEGLLRAAEIELCKRLLCKKASDNDIQTIEFARRANAEVQHHDAITGTAKEYVSQVYMMKLNEANERLCRMLMILKKITSVDNSFHVFNPLSCIAIGDCSISVSRPDVIVLDSNGNRLPSVIVPARLNPHPTISEYELSFVAPNLAPLQVQKFQLELEKDAKIAGYEALNYDFMEAIIGQKDNFLLVHCSRGDGLHMEFHFNGKKIKFDTYLYKYASYSKEGQHSGAYIFRPDGEAVPVRLDERFSKFEYIYTDFYEDFRVVYDHNHVQTFRVRTGDPAVEVFHKVGPLNINEELVTRIDFGRKVKLFTADNSLKLLERPTVPDKPAANFFPVTSTAVIRSKDFQIDATTDRTMAVAGQGNGIVEFLLHRRTEKDDQRGVEEPLNDTSVVYPSVYFYFTELELNLEEDVVILDDIIRFPPLVLSECLVPVDYQVNNDVSDAFGWSLLSLQYLNTTSDEQEYGGNSFQLLARFRRISGLIEVCDQEFRDFLDNLLPNFHKVDVFEQVGFAGQPLPSVSTLVKTFKATFIE